MVTMETKFLWMPKKINGKWYWLRNVYAHTEYQMINVGGNLAYHKYTVYSVKE